MSSYFENRMTEIMAGHEERSRAERQAQPPRPPKTKAAERQGYVYFFRAGNAVKIGFSTNLRSREEKLRMDCSERAFIARFVKGTMRTERQFHERFAEYRLRGEWFDLRGRLAKYLERHFAPIAFPAPTVSEREPEEVITL